MNLKALWYIVRRDTRELLGTADRFDAAVRGAYWAMKAGVQADVVKNVHAVKA